MQRKAAICDVADIEAVLGREQLAVVVNESKHAGHDGKRVRGDRAGCKIGPEQCALEDIEPPGGVGGWIIGAALAQHTMVPGKDCGGDFFHAVSLVRPHRQPAENRYREV